MSNKAGLYNGKQDADKEAESEGKKGCRIDIVLEVQDWGFEVSRKEFIQSMHMEVAAVAKDLRETLMKEYELRNKVEEDQSEIEDQENVL